MPSNASRVERLATHRYEFTSEWPLPVDLPTAFSVLQDLWSYPLWWPEFKRAEQTSEDSGAFAIRSVLPITLNFALQRDIDDEKKGLLRATATGDIVGTVEWMLTASREESTIANFTEQVTLHHPMARRFDIALRPVLAWNHTAMMRSGYRNLLRRIGSS